MSLWSVGREVSRDHLASLHHAGFSGVEVWAEHHRAAEELVQARRVGLEAGLHLPFHDLNLATPDPVVARHAESQLTGWLERLGEAGGRHAVLHGGYAWASEDRGEAVERVTERLAHLSERARELGLLLLLENLCPDRLLYTHWIASHLDEWLTVADNAHVLACLDLGHLAVMGDDLLDAATSLGSRLRSVHYSDNDRMADRHLWPGEGVGISNGFWETMERVRFEGPVIYEINPYRYSFDDLMDRVRQGGIRQ